MSNCALQYGNIASREAARRLHARFLATEPAEARLDTSTAAAENIGASDGSIPSTLTAEETKAEAVTLCPNCFGRNGSHNRIHERYPAGGGGTNKPCPNAPSVKAETTPTHCRCITPDWYHDGLDAEFDGRLLPSVPPASEHPVPRPHRLAESPGHDRCLRDRCRRSCHYETP